MQIGRGAGFEPEFEILSGNSSVGRAQPCQGWGRGFESRFPLQKLSVVTAFFICRGIKSSEKCSGTARFFVFLSPKDEAGHEMARCIPCNLKHHRPECPDGGTGRHAGLKILWPEMAVRVRFPLRVLKASVCIVKRRLFFFTFSIYFYCNWPFLRVLTNTAYCRDADRPLGASAFDSRFLTKALQALSGY